MRFYGFVFMAFVTAFAGVSWASYGFPVGQRVVTLLFGQPSVPREQRYANLRDAAKAYKLNPCDPIVREHLQKLIMFHMAANVSRLNPSQTERRDTVTDALQIAGFMPEDLPNLLAQTAACSPGQATR
jgi:hypothetical protein